MGRRKLVLDEEEEGRIKMNGKNKGKKKEEPVLVDSDEEEEEDEADLDEYENDGFIVDDEEEDGGSEDKQKKKKKKKRKSFKNIVLDDDDLELLEENKFYGFNQGKMGDGKFKRLKKASEVTELPEHFSDNEDEYKSDAEEDDMADFIVDEEEIYGMGGPVRRELNQVKNSSYLRKESRRGFANANELPEQPTEVLAESKKLDESTQFDSLIQINAFLGEKGHYIEDTDIPERMQIFEESVGPAPVDNMSLEEESSWILSQLAENLYPLFSEKIDKEDPNFLRPLNRINKEDIVRFLELHRLKKYDIPFISMYRKEQCLSLLEDPEQNEAENIYKDDAEGTPKLKCHKVLWAIKELDRKWLLLQKRKSALLMYFNKRFAEESQSSFCDPKASVNKQIFKSITKALEKAESEREIDDANMKFNLHFPPAEELGDSMYKRHVKKSHYNICTEAGLRLLVDKFGNPEQFGLQVTLENSGMEFHEDPNESPENIASEFMSDRFETSEDVLKGARHMAAVEISSEASFRKHVRNIFMDKALVSTSPTPEGDIVIDSFHQYSGVKWLWEKPLLKFEDAQWLLIQKAEEEKLLQVIVKLPDSTLNELKSVCADVYLRAEGRSSQLWNEQRRLILHDAISNFLLPSVEKEARELLTTKAKNWLLMEYGKQLWNRVSVAPYQCNGNVSKENGFTQRVMACCWGPGKPETTFVMLDSSGKLLDVLHAGSLTLWLRNMNDQQRKKSDQQRILRFLSNYQPKVIVLGAANVMCTRLKDDINEIISMMVEENLPDVSQQMNKVRVVFGDECLPNIYEHSQVSSDQLPRQPDIVKRAVALGRFLQNPLAMVATLCGVQKEILSWQLSPLQQFLTSDEKFEMIEWVMVDVTNQVGVDLSKAVSHDWLFAPLQFVSGLGPRKAALLHKESLGDIAVRNRRELTAYGLKTEKIFYNAVGFLRVCFNDPFSTDSDTDVLDGTRIHPESYAVAKELAEAVYRYNHKENANIDVSLVNAIAYIQENPILLQSFDINAYADTLQIERGEYGRETIYDIKNELVHGFIDPRRPYVEPTQDEEFDMISGKTGDAPLEGKRVEAIVRHVQSQRAFCVLGSGLTGILLKDDFSDEIDDISLSDKMHQGDKLACKIKEIEKNRYRVTLTCKASELKSGEQVHFHKLDPYYQKGQVILPSQPEKSYKDELANNHFKPRMISHPCFWNITAYQANEFLADKDIGEYIFHPSSRGPCYLTFTLKISDGLSVHKDIVEIGKDMLDMASLLRLGKTLKLGDERFEDIDEVMRNYINPLVVHLKTMLNFQKFKKGSKSEVDELLKAEKAEYPMRIAYGFGISYEHPGTCILSYIRSTNPHHEFVGIHPKGFKFRKQMFEKIEHMVSYFQKHINDPIVPPRDSRIGGSIGTSMAGDWRSNKVDQQGQSHSGKNDREDGWGQGRGRGRGRGQGRAPDCGTSDEGGYNGRYQNKDDSLYYWFKVG
ncbi:Transcription elongation factor SPT6-like protein [Quillaja saponaria]|uniref:Transcription elongation factor spt6 n=1 Tax=Quillaja saponaria TaxID=32244 RepID=A0AAD7QJ75_QUISA|nr:Transcription elongation factor SPT6-like protein [Quillaja saponaria]